MRRKKKTAKIFVCVLVLVFFTGLIPVKAYKPSPSLTAFVRLEQLPEGTACVDLLIPAGEADDYFVEKRIGNLLRKDPQIDTIILGCTHYPLLINKIIKYTPRNIRLVPQGEYVAYSLKSYLERHTEIDDKCTKGGTCRFLTTESPEKFKESASVFLKRNVEAERVTLE